MVSPGHLLRVHLYLLKTHIRALFYYSVSPPPLSHFPIQMRLSKQLPLLKVALEDLAIKESSNGKEWNQKRDVQGCTQPSKGHRRNG